MSARRHLSHRLTHLSWRLLCNSGLGVWLHWVAGLLFVLPSVNMPCQCQSKQKEENAITTPFPPFSSLPIYLYSLLQYNITCYTRIHHMVHRMHYNCHPHPSNGGALCV